MTHNCLGLDVQGCVEEVLMGEPDQANPKAFRAASIQGLCLLIDTEDTYNTRASRIA
jgi:hypothetical protein